MKYVLVSGGVISGIGKGVIASSTGLLLKTIGLKVTAIKIDPYLNVDAGTMAPTEHGEVFVLDDGGEVDLDLGNYERYLNITLTRENNITTGKIYDHVIKKERKGDYLGKTVQIIPHLTDAVQEWVERVAQIPVDDTNETPDVCIIELGGTVGDLESAAFIESMRQFRQRVGEDNFVQIHVSLVPVASEEQKTKPTQRAIKDVQQAGLFPDLIACRCDVPLEPGTINKIAMFWPGGNPKRVIAVHNVASTYHVPLLLHKQGLVDIVRERFKFPSVIDSPALVEKGRNIWSEWTRLTTSQERMFESVTIALVGKYTSLHDSYLSVIKSLEHSSMRCGKKLNLLWVDAEDLEEGAILANPAVYHKAWHEVCTANGILVPGGFGVRGTEGMIKAAEWARKNKIPYLGICLGMQIAVIEYARHVCGIVDAASYELNPASPDPVIVEMPEIDQINLGGTMRLGSRPTIFQGYTDWSKLRKLYGGKETILERHRHRFEVNPKYIERLTKEGLDFVGKDDKGERMEIIELKDHPWFVGVQFHPEYLSRVLHPSPPYLGFVAAASGCLDRITEIALQSGRAVGATKGVNGIVNGINGVVM